MASGWLGPALDHEQLGKIALEGIDERLFILGERPQPDRADARRIERSDLLPGLVSSGIQIHSQELCGHRIQLSQQRLPLASPQQHRRRKACSNHLRLATCYLESYESLLLIDAGDLTPIWRKCRAHQVEI